MKPQWAGDTARRLGLRGDVQFTTSRIGMTLHLPCDHNGDPHLVDFVCRPGLAPAGVASALIGKGWTMGSRLLCPEHSRTKSRSARIEEMPLPIDTPPAVEKSVRERRLEGSSKGGKLGGANVWKMKTPEQQRATMENMRLARAAKREAKAMNTPAKNQDLKVSDISMTPAAKKVHRLVMQALEDYYDETAKAYKGDHSDTSIANELGSSPVAVAKVREEFFGPIVAKAPPELVALKAEIQMAYAAYTDAGVTFSRRFAEYEKRLESLCRIKGWPLV